jgi:TetR/AcrR family transcriptional regulator, cholesterol catabolism regulator
MSILNPPARRQPHTGARTARPSKSQATRLRILEAAALVLAERGYADTRLSDIAAAAGTFAGSIYYHFASREELVEEVLTLGVTRTFDAVRARVEALPTDGGHRARITAAIEAHVTFANSSDRFAAANQRLFAQVPHDIRQRQIGQHRAYGAYWRRMLADARRAGEIRADLDLPVLRLQLLGAINWTVEWYRPGKRSTQEIAAQLAATLFDGIAPRGP